MQERETTSFQTPFSNQTIVIKTYLTGREKRQLTNVYLGEQLDFNTETNNLKGISSTLVDKAQDLAWKIIIVSIDGKKDGDVIDGSVKPFSVVDTILDMRAEDHDFIVARINELTAVKTEKKTT